MFLATIQKGDKKMVKNFITTIGNGMSCGGMGIMTSTKSNVFSVKRMAFASYFTVFMMIMLTMIPVFASGSPTATVGEILERMIDIIGMIFVAVGIVLAVYSVGQLVLAFKNEDADSKSRASTLLVVAIILIAFPAVIDFLGLTEYLSSAMG